NLGVSVGLDYNDLSLPDNGHLFEEITYKGEVGTVVLSNISKDNIYDDGVDTFTTGQYPNNYVWYSGKLWRAVSANNEEKTVKLVTQWAISAISYSSGSSTFEGSYMEEWLNDKTVDGFLGNLRNPEDFIKMDSKWNATMMTDNSKPPSEEESGTIVEATVGLLNYYETRVNNGYLCNGNLWTTLTPYNTSNLWNKNHVCLSVNYNNVSNALGIRPSINLKKEINIVDGDGSEENPYRLEGDYDTNLEGTLLNTRYSGEYISFGTGENNLYRIISHETEGLTKITSAEPLKDNGGFKTLFFGDSLYYSSANTIGSFLNGEYLSSGTYLTEEQVNMIEDSTTWYLGTVGGVPSYKLAKYTDTNMSGYATSTEAKIGLLRTGELMAGQFKEYNNNMDYWTLTPFNSGNIFHVFISGMASGANFQITSYGIKPSLNLKQNVIITGGDGTLQNPFTLALE
ncbi:MAG TPA: hypothetical protein IAB38_01415, partial [Candidatus Onthousia excrementipullorum]|nr:hypothetical protein [Candidatus Onthousia excrementipullorum]